MDKFLILSFILVFASAVIGSSTRNRTFSKFKKFKRNSTPTFSFTDTWESINNENQYHPDNFETPKKPSGSSAAAFFKFPVGTTLRLTPAVHVPITEDDGDVTTSKSSVNLEFPIEITFKTRPWESSGIFDDKTNRNFHVRSASVRNPGQDNLIKRSDIVNHERLLLSRKLRDLDSSASSGNRTVRNLDYRSMNDNCPKKSFLDRKSILTKLELFAGTLLDYSENPRQCLLRWTCEMHKNSVIASRYGLIGEGALLVFSVEKLSRQCSRVSPELKYLKPFIQAELAGQSGKCLEFEKKCSQSLFVL